VFSDSYGSKCGRLGLAKGVGLAYFYNASLPYSAMACWGFLNDLSEYEVGQVTGLENDRRDES
jgi:hypothetical protein